MIFILKEWSAFSTITALPDCKFPLVEFKIIPFVRNVVVVVATSAFSQEEKEIEKTNANNSIKIIVAIELNVLKLIVFIFWV